ncbi:VOC family protein [Nocardia vermiculata]|uniref:Glyoxalase/bleomycin resistance/extradiol dioxygenase family protein n=1 Tax=Nocardia vermiculata TaxID=257274 RepID=A0A846Y1Q9_9NOCA|nr:VOC family protein [Nocardia vermiculata]NKY53193.1 glyoxalase/bleomycin resistance/extradiol dioxygenase family protein [Nocardia vermiculata]
MAGKMIFINLPVENLARSISFYEALGWKVNPDFTDENAGCVVVDDNICLMLLARPFFETFTSRPVADTRAATGSIYALSLGSAAEVESLLAAATAAGATEEVSADKQAQEEAVGMFSRAFVDPDGHHWEAFWMNYPGAS